MTLARGIPPAHRGGDSLTARFLRLATVRSSAIYAVTGVAFMVANVVLARALPVADYATVTLAVALVGFGGLIGPLGQDRVLVRRNLAATPGLLAWGTAASASVGLVVGVVATAVYGLGASLAASLFLGATAYAVGILAAAKLQSEGRFVHATLVAQAPSPLLLAAALLLAGVGLAGAAEVAGLFAAGLAAVAAVTWRRLLAAAGPAPPAYRIDWSESLALTGLGAMSALAASFERLAIPLALPGPALAEFGVLAALVVGPLRMLQLATQRTLTPRLRDAASPAARRGLLRREAALLAGLTAAAGAVLWFAVPLAVPLLLGGKYDLSPALVAAALASGAARVASGLATATVTALSPRERLHLVNAT
ncbi:MAG TPA: hypothetical protein VF606_13000, partial [Geminicoccaceae bacterium]